MTYDSTFNWFIFLTVIILSPNLRFNLFAVYFFSSAIRCSKYRIFLLFFDKPAWTYVIALIYLLTAIAVPLLHVSFFYLSIEQCLQNRAWSHHSYERTCIVTQTQKAVQNEWLLRFPLLLCCVDMLEHINYLNLTLECHLLQWHNQIRCNYWRQFPNNHRIILLLQRGSILTSFSLVELRR